MRTGARLWLVVGLLPFLLTASSERLSTTESLDASYAGSELFQAAREAAIDDTSPSHPSMRHHDQQQTRADTSRSRRKLQIQLSRALKEIQDAKSTAPVAMLPPPTISPAESHSHLEPSEDIHPVTESSKSSKLSEEFSQIANRLKEAVAEANRRQRQQRASHTAQGRSPNFASASVPFTSPSHAAPPAAAPSPTPAFSDADLLSSNVGEFPEPVTAAAPSEVANKPRKSHANTNGGVSNVPFNFPPLVWMAPFFSGGGYCTEAIQYVLALDSWLPELRIIPHGDAYSQSFMDGLNKKTDSRLMQLYIADDISPSESVVVCHSQPTLWFADNEFACPPQRATPLYVVGRTMFETDRLPKGWAEHINKVNEVWVPTQFHADIFAKEGVKRAKIKVVPESIDVKFFDPYRTLPYSKLPDARKEDFKFLSIFKWEERKGWRFLLEAYFREFSSDDRVCLYILTRAFDSTHAFHKQINLFVSSLNLTQPKSSYPRIQLLHQNVADRDMPGLYRSVDAFVLPSRGEGWGRPQFEAMAMALPVLTTNWSGPTEFLNDGNGYPIKVERMEPATDFASDERGPHLWARPSVDHLRQTMRHVMTHKTEAMMKGIQARADIERKYCLDCVARVLLDALKNITVSIDFQPLDLS